MNEKNILTKASENKCILLSKKSENNCRVRVKFRNDVKKYINFYKNETKKADKYSKLFEILLIVFQSSLKK